MRCYVPENQSSSKSDDQRYLHPGSYRGAETNQVCSISLNCFKLVYFNGLLKKSTYLFDAETKFYDQCLVLDLVSWRILIAFFTFVQLARSYLHLLFYDTLEEKCQRLAFKTSL